MILINLQLIIPYADLKFFWLINTLQQEFQSKQ